MNNPTFCSLYKVGGFIGSNLIKTSTNIRNIMLQNIKNFAENIIKFIGPSKIIFLRECIIKVISFKLIGIEVICDNEYPLFISNTLIMINKKFYKNILFSLMSPCFFFGINHIFRYCKINYLYKLENIYFYEDYTNSKIMNIIVKANIGDEDVTELFKKYHSNVPFYLFLINENILFKNCDDIYNVSITSIVKGKIIKNKVDNFLKKIYDLC
jgi:hypothetical protein